MSTERLKAYQTGPALDLADERRIEASRPADRWAEVGPGDPPYRLLWCQVREAAPADPPDERYYADEVRPAGADAGGHLEWETVPDGLQEIVVHNVPEAGQGTHLVEAGAVIRVEERVDEFSLLRLNEAKELSDTLLCPSGIGGTIFVWLTGLRSPSAHSRARCGSLTCDGDSV